MNVRTGGSLDQYFPGGVVYGRQFLYVYAKKDEYILLGSSNRTGAGNGVINVYAPQNFGSKGSEPIPSGGAAFTCTSGTTGRIQTRSNELAGPNSADGTATVTNGYTPCVYKAPSDGIYGVMFTGTGSTTTINDTIDGTLETLSEGVAAWDVTVRNSNPKSLVDINGRVFTYAWTVNTGGNNVNTTLTNRKYRISAAIYYVSLDGYRYKQEFRGVDPYRAAFYANQSGFLDTNGAPLYHDFRGGSQTVTGGASASAGIVPQPPQYPIFFSDVSPGGPNAAEVNTVLTALSIPSAPLAPVLSNPAFLGNIGGNTSTVSAGGTFTFDTVNTLTYEIVIKRGAVAAGVDPNYPSGCVDNFDPANVCNRVLTGTASTGSHVVLWDGKDNSGFAFPANAAGTNYPFQIVGRNGEIHFPMADIEANVNGGPTLTKLNGAGAGDTTVYFDDRGYKTANGTLIGQLNGRLCGASSTAAQPAPTTYSLVGVDSSQVTNGPATGINALYYRYWNSNSPNTQTSGATAANPGTDCVNANQFFGDAKGLDVWALQKSQTYSLPIEIIPPASSVDVGTMVSVTPSVVSGDSAYGSFVFTNAGSSTATAVTYAATLGSVATPATCPASVNFTMVPAGVTATYRNASDPTPALRCTITFAGMPTTLTSGQTLTFNFNYVVAPTNPGPIPVTTTISAGNETCTAPTGCAPNTASAQTVVAKPVISVVKSADPTAGSQVSINDVITYTVSVTVDNAPLESQFTLTDVLGTGLTFGAVSSKSPAFTCSGSLTCTLPANTATGTYTVTYTATVNTNAVGSVANNVTPSGGGGTSNCSPCSVTHTLPTPVISVAKASNPVSGTAVIAGQTITYTLTTTITNAPLSAPLVLTDTLSANQTFGAVTSAGSYSCTGSVCTLAAGTVPGTYPVTYTATVDASATGTVYNNVVASGGGATPTCSSCSTTHPMASPVISVAKASNPASGTAVVAGQTINYTLTATVSQAALTSPLVLADTLSANQTFGSVTSAGSFTCNGAVNCSLPAGTPPGTYAVSYTATVGANAIGTVSNNVAASGGGSTPTCSSCSTTHPVNSPAISVAKTSNPTSGSTVTPGQTITYTLTATVSEAALTSNLVLTDTLGSGLTFGAVTSSGAFTCTGTLSCTLPAGIAPGTYAVSYTATVKANANGSVGNSVAASGGSPTDPACTSCSTTHPVADPRISVAKASDPTNGSAVSAGQTITYTLTATVDDAALTSPLVLTDTLSANQTFGSVTSAGAFTCTGALQCTLPAGTPPGTYAVSYTATVKASASGSVANNVTATGGSPTDPTCTSCSTTHPLKDPAISVVKASNPVSGTAVAAGETITFTLTATVSEAALTSNLVLTDTLGAGLTFGSVTSAGNFTCTGSLQCTLPAGTVPGTYAVSYTATVKASASGSVANNVTARESDLRFGDQRRRVHLHRCTAVHAAGRHAAGDLCGQLHRDGQGERERFGREQRNRDRWQSDRSDLHELQHDTSAEGSGDQRCEVVGSGQRHRRGRG
ncbi:MAG: isopeptide-forming domain-containing fimbrial protein [Rhodanobacteraceae bacterium]|nr:isopeptide-forming domain-containing fimbrial protein [Rhodanobacteraceae bacterium]